MKIKNLFLAGCLPTFFSIALGAQDLVLEYQTPPGAMPGFFIQRPCAGCIPMDVNGDNKDETVFIRNRPNGYDAFIVLDGATGQLSLIDSTCCPLLSRPLADFSFRGFHNLDGTGLAEAVFYTRPGVTPVEIAVGWYMDSTLFDRFTSFKTNWRLLEVRNTDADPASELVLYNVQTKRLEVWGAGFTPGIAPNDQPPNTFANGGGEMGFEVQNTLNNVRQTPSDIHIQLGYQDYNGDKIPDFSYIEPGNPCKLTIVSGKNRQILWSGNFNIPAGQSPCSQLSAGGFFDFDGSGKKAVLNTVPDPDSIFFGIQNAFVFDPATGNSDNSLQPYLNAGGRIFAVTDLDRDNKTEIALFHAANRQVLILGVGGDEQEHKPDVPPPAETGDFALKLRFESPPGLRLPFTGSSTEDRSELDYNGDTAPDLCIWKEMPNDTSIAGLLVFDVKNKSALWEFNFPLTPLEKEPVRRFHGFFDIDADGQKEMYLGNYTVVTADKMIHQPFGENFTLQLIRDLDGDGFPEALGRTAAGRIQIWSRSVSTPVDNPGVAASLNFRCYPNPTAAAFQVEYTLPKPGFVQIQVHDVQGRLIAEVQAVQVRAPGVYRANFQLDSGHPSGLCFLSLNFENKRYTRLLWVGK